MSDSILHGAMPEPDGGLSTPVRDSFWSAPGWREIGMQYSCVPNVETPWDPMVLREIWTFDPGIIPIWVDWIFQSPADDAGGHRLVSFGRHAVGRRCIDPTGVVIPEGMVRMPQMPCQGVTFETPNILIRIFEGNKDPQDAPDLPGEFVPFDMRIYKKLREDYIENMSLGDLKGKYIYDPLATRERRSKKVKEEWDYRMRDLNEFVTKKLENVSDVEIKEHFGRLKERARARASRLGR